MNSFEEFKNFIALKSIFEPFHIKNKELLYLVTYPDKLKWNYGIEKQTQMTYLQMSGGTTGAGSGYNIKLCKQSEVIDLLKKETDSTHVMICSVGMIFVVTARSNDGPITAITDFHEFVESGKYCKAHIIAKPGDVLSLVTRHLAEPWPKNPKSFTASLAYLHYQHIELNLDIWRQFECPDIYEKFEYEERADGNYHDDYTPHWIIPKEFPKINNFTHSQRSRKAFSYERDDGDNIWNDIREGVHDFDNPNVNNYFNRLNQNFNQHNHYYIENNEKLGKLPEDQEFDLLFSPCGGFSTEVIAHKLNFNGKIIIYDYSQKILDIKKQILDTNPDYDEIRVLEKIHSDITFIWGLYDQIERRKSFGTYEEIRFCRESMCENYDIDFWLMDLIKPDYNRLLKEVKGKRVFFNASNIFSYNKVILRYTLSELYESFDKLFEVLDQAEDYHFRGSIPRKKFFYDYPRN